MVVTGPATVLDQARVRPCGHQKASRQLFVLTADLQRAMDRLRRAGQDRVDGNLASKPHEYLQRERGDDRVGQRERPDREGTPSQQSQASVRLICVDRSIGI